MYWTLIRNWVEQRLRFRRRRRWLRAGIAAIALFVVVAGILIADSRKAENESLASMEAAGRPGQPGERDPIVLARKVGGDGGPQFTSATLLPGHGMGVLQITASMPGQGEVKLLASGEWADGAFLEPWAGRLGGMAGDDGTITSIAWRGRTFRLYSDGFSPEGPKAYGGMLLNAAVASRVDTSSLPDGEMATGRLVSGEFGGGWPSQTETIVSVKLASRTMELSMLVKNTGTEATPVGVGWAPRFVLPGGQREKVMLRIPALMREVTEQSGSGMPTGALDRVKGTAYDFSAAGGAALGRSGLDDTFVHLEKGIDGYPAIQVRNPAAKFGLRMVVLSDTVKAVHVRSPPNAGFISISPQMNYDDPFGGEWKMSEDTGMLVLQPGQSVEWKVRLELFEL
jgi:hypothetical protein